MWAGNGGQEESGGNEARQVGRVQTQRGLGGHKWEFQFDLTYNGKLLKYFKQYVNVQGSFTCNNDKKGKPAKCPSIGDDKQTGPSVQRNTTQ